MDKAALRKEMVARRAEAAGTADQGAARDRLLALLQTCEGPISFYWPIRTEIDPRPVMERLATTQPVCLPLTHGRAAPLSFLAWTPGTAMVKDGFGVPVPDGTETLQPRTLVVPMLAFDDAGHRLGYGAGHYDRTLDGLRAQGPVMAIGFAFEAQRSAALLPSEPTDQPLNAIVTDTTTHRFDA